MVCNEFCYLFEICSNFWQYFGNQFMKQPTEPKTKFERNAAADIYEDAIPKVTATFELTVSQANAIQKLLPTGHALRVQYEKTKHITKRGPHYKCQHLNREELKELGYAQSKLINHSFQILPSRLVAKKCSRILSLLKRCDQSKHFQCQSRQLQDVVDLSSIGVKLRLHQYKVIGEFFKDVEQFIKNVYDFFKDNKEFIIKTKEFEKVYQKLKAEVATLHEKEKKTKRIIRKSRRIASAKTTEIRKLKLRLKLLPKQKLQSVICLLQLKSANQLCLGKLSQKKLEELKQTLAGIEQELLAVKSNHEIKSSFVENPR